MRKLENDFRSKGMNYKTILRFSVEKGEKTVSYIYCSVEDSHFAVMEVIEDKESERFGVVIPAHERIPSSEQWGQKAWSFQTEEQALIKMTFLRYESTKEASKWNAPAAVKAKKKRHN